MIRCGWCRRATSDEAVCGSCGHPSPRQPWEQRGLQPPEIDEHTERLRDAQAELRRQGRPVTVEALAEHLGVDARTVQRWRANAVRMSPVRRGDVTGTEGSMTA